METKSRTWAYGDEVNAVDVAEGQHVVGAGVSVDDGDGAADGSEFARKDLTPLNLSRRSSPADGGDPPPTPPPTSTLTLTRHHSRHPSATRGYPNPRNTSVRLSARENCLRRYHITLSRSSRFQSGFL